MRKLIYGFSAMMVLLAGQVFIDVARAGEVAETVAEVEKVAEAAPSMKDMAAGMLKSIIETATIAKDFLAKEIPIVIQELLTYYTALYSLFVGIGVLLLVFAYFWQKHWRRVYNDKENGPENTALINRRGYGHDYTGYLGLAFAPGVFFSIVGVVFLSDITNLLKITLAPRIWLIEYARNLL